MLSVASRLNVITNHIKHITIASAFTCTINNRTNILFVFLCIRSFVSVLSLPLVFLLFILESAIYNESANNSIFKEINTLNSLIKFKFDMINSCG